MNAPQWYMIHTLHVLFSYTVPLQQPISSLCMQKRQTSEEQEMKTKISLFHFAVLGTLLTLALL
jgi:hypothetical protein